MYLALKAGKTVLLKVAQWVQLAEAYSTIFTAALGSPIVMSSVEVADPRLQADRRRTPATAIRARGLKRDMRPPENSRDNK
jgi:hypothetical protein